MCIISCMVIILLFFRNKGKEVGNKEIKEEENEKKKMVNMTRKTPDLISHASNALGWLICFAFLPADNFEKEKCMR
ncbi:hypothetical protein J3Q64DRAFT_1729110 [Phycomyces blakesleeanus]|uniref:Uncharacterized protein n=1 Tax=Phycomyces blakesleeanus TaxID=4837 RepID=A0ABR3B626_PHYBL